MPRAAREKAPLTLLLPPSETKRPGGDGPALDVSALAFPALREPRERLLGALTELAAGDPDVALKSLGLSPGQRDQLALDAALRTAPTSPALFRYTGVLYDAFDPAGLTPAQRKRAADRVVVASALFGAVRGGDLIPAYRFSAGARLPGFGTLAALWKPILAPVLGSLEGVVVDLRSGAYAQLAPVPGAVTVRVLYVAPDGSRSVVSHFNKHAKGLLTRALAITTANVVDAAGVVRVAANAGLLAERNGPSGVDVLLHEPPAGTPAAARAVKAASGSPNRSR